MRTYNFRLHDMKELQGNNKKKRKQNILVLQLFKINFFSIYK
jgi:hypothetical protein